MGSPNDPHQGREPDGGQGRPWDQSGQQWAQQPPQDQQWNQPQQAEQWGQAPQQHPQQGQWGWQQDQPQGQQWQPQQGQPGQQWGQGQPGQWDQQSGQPQQGRQWGQGQQGQWDQQPTQQWGQPQPGQPWAGGQPPYGPGQPGHAAGGQPPKKNKAVLITAVAVVVALLAGVGVYFLAIRNSSGGGKDTPVAAAQQLFADVDNGDLVGLTDTFDPVEARFVNDLMSDVVEQFKRLGLLTDDATVNNSTGMNISIKGITFDDSAEEKPLPDLTIVKLTGGIITINPAQSTGHETDLFKSLIDGVQRKAADQDIPMTSASEPTTIDIAEVIRDKNDGKPIRISTVQRDGSWYPSLLYTAADYWAQEAGVGAVTTADAIPGAGQDSPEAALNAMIQAIVDQDAAAVIGLLPPDEMSAVHAYGKKIVDAIGAGTAQDVKIQAEWNESDVTGGKLLSIKSLQFTAGSESGSIEIDQAAGSVTVTDGTDTKTFTADDLGELIGESDLEQIHPDMPEFVQRMVKAALGLGVVTTEVDGKWYVSPLRSYSSILTVLLQGMEQRDMEMFVDLLNQ